MCLGPRTANASHSNVQFKIQQCLKNQQQKILHQSVHAQRHAWKTAGAGSVVQAWLEHGTTIPWKDGPPPPFHQGASLLERTKDQEEFWQREKNRLVECGAWEKVSPRPGLPRFVTKAFLVPKPGTNKWRLVVDLRFLNSFVINDTTKFETLKNLRRLARRGEWLFSFDLADGFYAITIHPDFRKYLTVEVDGELFQFVGLPMGWNRSPYVFCKTMRTLVQELRSPDAPKQSEVRQTSRKRILSLSRRGMRVLPYIDDFLVVARTRREALRFRKRVQETLDRLGLRRNEQKGHWEPTQRIVHLGLEIDTKEGLFRVPEERLTKLTALARDIIQTSKRRQRLIPKRVLASFTGLAQSVYLAVAPARFYLRELHDVMSSRTGWSALVRVTKQAYRDLHWWKDIPAKWNGREIWRAPDSAIIHCDASKTAWGGVLNNHTPARSFWTASEMKLHITHLELQAVYNTVRSFLPWLRNRHVLLREDNMAVVHMITNKTTRSRPLMDLLRRLWFLCDINNVELRTQYIRSAANVWADALSRDLDVDDWKLNPKEFQRKDREWGGPTGHTVDRFASWTSAQLPRYYSENRDPECEGTNSLSHDWTGEQNWVNPPWNLLPEVAQKLREEGASATVVAPYWPATDWFRELWALSSQVEIVPPRQDLFLPTRLGASAHLGPAKWSAIFFRIPAQHPPSTQS